MVGLAYEKQNPLSAKINHGWVFALCILAFGPRPRRKAEVRGELGALPKVGGQRKKKKRKRNAWGDALHDAEHACTTLVSGKQEGASPTGLATSDQNVPW